MFLITLWAKYCPSSGTVSTSVSQFKSFGNFCFLLFSASATMYSTLPYSGGVLSLSVYLKGATVKKRKKRRRRRKKRKVNNKQQA